MHATYKFANRMKMATVKWDVGVNFFIVINNFIYRVTMVSSKVLTTDIQDNIPR